MVAIKDFHIDNPNKDSICAGFMVLKSNYKMRRLFNPKLITKNDFKIHDQEIINSKKKWIKYEYLDTDLYTNGSYFLKNNNIIDPVVIHFNYIVGEKKKEIMKEHGYWFL